MTAPNGPVWSATDCAGGACAPAAGVLAIWPKPVPVSGGRINLLCHRV